VSTPQTSGDEARQALLDAERKLAEQKAKSGIIARVTSSLSRLAAENHFSARLAELFREGP
jgi:hypothetical protein